MLLIGFLVFCWLDLGMVVFIVFRLLIFGFCLHGLLLIVSRV